MTTQLEKCNCALLPELYLKTVHKKYLGIMQCYFLQNDTEIG
jgi:hypothetical protein